MKPKRKDFQFKQFSVTDQNSTLKTGTDAVLIGAWANIETTKSILDVGCGSGIISLILAQRNHNVVIDAIDIHEGSIQDARQNFDKSIWNDRLQVIHTSWSEFLSSTKNKYDLIVSNPPFFINSLRSPQVENNLSKHSHTLSGEILISSAKKLLNPDGRLVLILPLPNSQNIKNMANENGLSLSRQLNIFPKTDRPANRVIFDFVSGYSHPPKITNLTIRNLDNTYTSEYKLFTKEFYLNF